MRIDLLASDAVSARVTLTLLELDRPVATATHRVRLPAGASTRRLAIRLPSVARRGYGLRATVVWAGGHAVGDGAVEALDGWWQSPRHAAITRYRSPAETAAAVTNLAAWHVNVVQLYDWMYRHYRYEPPSGETFVDTLGQLVSHDAVRAGVRAGHQSGIASLAYGSVYGAEREYVDAHPDERVFDADGRPLSLGETFYINDLRPGSPWRRRLLREYRAAVRHLGVDGIHMDTYGPPHRVISHDGDPIDHAAIYPGLIADGARAVSSVGKGKRVLFNCVEGFPLEAVATAPAPALYLELWPPDETYADVVRWVHRARAAGEGRAIVIAAYVGSLRVFEHDRVRRAGAVEAAILLTVIITAAGAFHHVLADRERILVEGYYPEARALRRPERRDLRAAWAFSARYVHLLSDPGATDVDRGDLEILDASGAPVPLSDRPVAGAVWVRVSAASDGSTVVQLIDLIEQAADRWDDARQRSPRRVGWRVGGSIFRARGRWVAACPWTAAGSALPVRGDQLPGFHRWVMLVAD